MQEELLMKNLEEIKNKTITIKAKADEKGHLFSAIHEKNVSGNYGKRISCSDR